MYSLLSSLRFDSSYQDSTDNYCKCSTFKSVDFLLFISLKYVKKLLEFLVLSLMKIGH